MPQHSRPLTKPLSVPSSGPTSEQISTFSSNVSDDIRRLYKLLDAVSNRQELLDNRFHRESEYHAQSLDGLNRQISLLTQQMSSREELEELAASGNITNLPERRGSAYFFFPGMSALELIQEGTTLEPNNGFWAQPHGARGGLTLPIISRRSVLFGNDPLTGEVVFPEDLAVTYIPVNEGQPVAVEQTRPILALTDNPLEPFVRTVMLPHNDPREIVFGSLDITVPPAFSGSLQANLLELSPFPHYHCTVYNIQLFSPSGSLIDTIHGPWSEKVLVPIKSTGPAGIGRVVVGIAAGRPQYLGGYKTFTFGLSRLGLFNAQYGQEGKFLAYFNSTRQLPITNFLSLHYNATGGEMDLITTGRLRLQLQVPSESTHGFPFGSDEFNASWVTVYDTHNHLDGYATPGQGNRFFPAAGVSAATWAAGFRIAGQVSLVEGRLRPLLSDIEVVYTQN